MSFREKTAWTSLLSVSGIYGLYFWSVMHRGHFGLLEAIIAVAVVQAALTIAVAILTPKEAKAPRDEREKMIDLKATQFAYAVLASSVALACFFGAFKPPIVFSTNAWLLVLVAAEILRSGCQVVQYRRGA